jgi:hypothetical protein
VVSLRKGVVEAMTSARYILAAAAADRMRTDTARSPSPLHPSDSPHLSDSDPNEDLSGVESDGTEGEATRQRVAVVKVEAEAEAVADAASLQSLPMRTHRRHTSLLR